MNKMMTSALMLGAGMIAYNYAQNNNMISTRKMKKMQNKITRAIF